MAGFLNKNIRMGISISNNNQKNGSRNFKMTKTKFKNFFKVYGSVFINCFGIITIIELDDFLESLKIVGYNIVIIFAAIFCIITSPVLAFLIAISKWNQIKA